MKVALPATVDTITNGYVNEVAVIVHAEWNHNRYYRTIVDNTPSEDAAGYDIEIFPIDSITKTDRPHAGINKAVVGQARVEPKNHDVVPSARYYVASTEDDYKYWQSPVASSPTAPYAITSCSPQVTYVEELSDNPVTVYSNKIFYTVESSWAYPVTYDVQAKQTTGGAWVTVASNVPVPASGKVELWFDGTNWTTTKNLDHSTTISAVRLVVSKMSAYGYFNLIELGAALELDLSDDVISTSDEFTMGEIDFITPLGTISSNTGSITFMNEDEKYTNTNESSVLYNLLDKGIRFTCWFAYGSDKVKEFEMFSDTWTEEDDQTTVDVKDNTQLFMDTKPPVVLYQDVPVQEAVWRICDIIGFNNYEVTTLDTSPHSMIDIFWTDGEKTAWELFGELARATQTAIYFDSDGVLQVKTRGAAWDDTRPVDYTLLRTSIPGGQPSNIMTLSDSTQYDANKATVNWKPTGFSETVDNITPFEVVWEPDGDVVLRASELKQNLTETDTIITMNLKDGATWPTEGIMNIEGEWIAYKGKEYVNYAGGSRQISWIDDFDEQKKLDDNTPGNMTHLNQYTGRLKVKERGLYNTEVKAHRIDLANWTTGRQRNYGATNSPASGVSLNPGESSVTIESPKNSDMKDYTYLYHGSPADDGYWFLGTRMKVDKTSHRDKVGGIFFNADAGLGSGYFLEITATAKFNGQRRATGNEVMFYSMKSDGSKKVFGGEKVNIKDKSKNHKETAKTKKDIGSEKAVVQGQYNDFDIRFSVAGNGDHIIQIWCVGSILFSATVPNGSGWQHTKSGRFGLYARGHSSVTFEYVYAVNNLGVEPTDGEPYYDRISGGYYGTQAADWTYGTREKRKKVKKKWTKWLQKYNQRFFDDFGAWAHEIRDFDVKYTNDLPSLQAKLYMSNSTQCVPLEFWTTPKTAHFLIANVSRQNAVINGDDELTAQGNGTINHKLFVYGRPVIQKDAQQTVKTDEWALRRRGINEIEYDSDWIQNEQEANRLAEWLTSHWSRSDSSLEVEVFGNPLLELTDIVRVKSKDIDADYYVVGVSNTFDQGVSTGLSLRKVTRAIS